MFSLFDLLGPILRRGSPVFLIFIAFLLAPTSDATAALSATKVTADSTKIYFTIPYTKTPNWIRVHIDADRNATTGYSFGNIGSGWMLQNGQLYQYTGSGGTNWSWSVVKNVSYSVANGVARFTINRSDIGNPAGITLISETDPPVRRSGTISLTLPVVLSNTPTEPTPTPTEPTPTPTEPTPTPTEPTPTPTTPTPTPTEPTPTPTPPAC